MFAKMKQASLDSAGEGSIVGDLSPSLEPVNTGLAKIQVSSVSVEPQGGNNNRQQILIRTKQLSGRNES